MAERRPPSEVVERFRLYFGPTGRAFAALDASGQSALRRDLEQHGLEHNLATHGTNRVEVRG